MYNNSYGFRDKPFEPTPDPNFLYLTQKIREVNSSIEYGIKERRGFILLTGQPGTGKTTIINSILQNNYKNSKFAYIFNPTASFHELLVNILWEFDLEDIKEDISIVNALNRLNAFAIEEFKRKINVVIIIDEGQHLSIKTLGDLRLLSNLETWKSKLIHIIIAGQPELEKKLQDNHLRQLAHRFTIRQRPIPLTERET